MKGLRPPGPKRHLLTGNSREFYKDQLAFLTKSAREFGDVVRMRFLHVPVYLLNNPKHIELVFSSRNFIKPMSLRLPLQRRIFGNGLLASGGDVWLRQRRLTQPAFHQARLSAYGNIMVVATEKMMAHWQAGEVHDVYDEMRTLALGIAAKCLFGADLDSDSAVVLNACRTIAKVFESQGAPLWILDNFLPTPNNLRFRKAIKQLDEIINDLISTRLTRRNEGDDLLSVLLFAKDDDGWEMNRQQLRDELATLFFASHEAVALTLSWTCYLLARHPNIQEALGNELESVAGVRETPSAADLAALRYTRMVIREALRLYPPNRSVGREALNDCEIGDYHVPAGTQLLMSQWVVHRDSRYFDEPEEFKPDRWTTEFIKQLPKYAYFPFGGGPRVCVGQDFAMMEAMLVIATVLRRFRITLINEEPVEPHPVVLLRPRSRIKIRLADRRHGAVDHCF
ncbi:MAG TPA: cytochrome P450 [Pyrinomonadaceae bacterium]|jgi:cytochrome P450|nr:cytochrome P450 [Pyrinomonadaceae bacterium]